jgi:ATP-binding cassette subfamily B multidrug efflux pump
MRFDHGYSEEDHLGKPYDLGLLKRLVPFLRSYRRLMTGSVLLVVVITLLELALPYFTKTAIDRYIVPTAGTPISPDPARPHQRRRYITVETGDESVRSVIGRYPHLFEHAEGAVRIALEDFDRIAARDRVVLRRSDLAGLSLVVLIYLGVVVAEFGFNFLQRMIMEYTGHKVMHDVRLRLYEHIQQQSMAFFTRQPVARLVTRMTNDVQNMHEFFTTFITLVFKDLFLLVGIAAVLMALDWRLALAGLTMLPLVAWATRRFSSRARSVFRALRIKVAEINTRMSESIEGIKTIQSFGREQANYQDFAALNAENYRLGMQEIHVYAMFMPMIEVLGIVSVAILIFYGGLHVQGGRISLGALVASLTYMRMFFRPLRDLAENYNILQNAMSSAERIFGLLDTDDRLLKVSLPVDENRGRLGRKGVLEMDRVSFSYAAGEKVLHQVSFSVGEGETLAIVGPTGAGKTSILNLILRLYDPDSGEIRLDGRPIRQWEVGRLRSFMALVPQDPILFSGTLRHNIFPNGDNDRRHGDEAYADEIVAAANCTDFISRLPQGLDTPLVKGGSGLSSGERQLVAIARAFARDPRIILLDEATSYIDSQTEAAIHKALHNLMQGRTCIIVAHRLSTARAADKIVVIQNGRVAEHGTHDQLMAVKGLYWRLNRQGTGTEAIRCQG